MADEELLDQDAEETEEGEGAAEGAEKSLQEKLKEAIDVKTDDVGPLRKKLTVTVPEATIGEQLDQQYGDLRRDANVPGFRKGRAPRRLLEKRFGTEVGETLVQQLVTNSYMAAIERLDLKVVGDPLLWVKEENGETLVDVQKAIETMKLPKEGDLVYACEVEIRPEFELPEIEGIPVEKPTLTVSDEQVESTIDRLRRNMGTFVPVLQGGVEADDVILADIKITSGETVLQEQENVRLAARPQVVDGVVLDNLGEVLKDATTGQTRTISGTIPDDYAKQDFRGKQADFEIKVREIQRLQMPELDERLLHSLGFDSQEELRKWVRADMESRIGEEVRRGMRGQVYNYLLEKTSFEVPGRLSERQSNRALVRRMLDLYREGVSSSDVEKHLDELKTGAQEQTTRELKLFFIMEKLAEKIEVDVSEGELNSQIAAIAQRQGRRFDRVRDELAREGTLAMLFMQLRDDKIVDHLLEKANVTEKTPEQITAEAEAKEPEKKPRAKKTQKKDADEAADAT